MSAHANSVYKSISEDIRKKIKDGKYSVGDMLESERNLMEIYGAQRTTIRRALELLVRDGVIEKCVGLGSVVIGENGKANVEKNIPNKKVNKVFVKRDTLPKAIEVVPDFEGAAEYIFDELLRLGHKKIMHITSDIRQYAVFCAEAIKRGVYDKELFIFNDKELPDELFSYIWRRLASPKPTAIIVQNARWASLITETAQRMRLDIPQELSLAAVNSSGNKNLCGCTFDDKADKKVLAMIENTDDANIYRMRCSIECTFNQGNTIQKAMSDSIGTGRLSDYLL